MPGVPKVPGAIIRRMDYRHLVAWQKAMDLAEAVYLQTSEFPLEERYGLISQMRRAAWNSRYA
jgi:hypothetical protein